MNIHPCHQTIRRTARTFRPPFATQARNHLIAFAFGVAFGLILSLWWRAAQIHQAERDAQIIEASSGTLPE